MLFIFSSMVEISWVLWFCVHWIHLKWLYWVCVHRHLNHYLKMFLLCVQICIFWHNVHFSAFFAYLVKCWTLFSLVWVTTIMTVIDVILTLHQNFGRLSFTSIFFVVMSQVNMTTSMSFGTFSVMLMWYYWDFTISCLRCSIQHLWLPFCFFCTLTYLSLNLKCLQWDYS